MKIEWKYSSPDEFQTFCNALLSLEIGPGFEGFDAPGKDGGVDGRYSGRYGKLNGLWRFQYKFHATARKVAVQSFRKDIVSEIQKIKTEDQLILLTNVPLNPAEKRELDDLARTTLAKQGKSGVRVELWHGSKLDRLFVKYPLLKLWMDEGFSTASVVPYRQGFRERLDASSSDINTLSNFFVSRQTELAQLEAFIDAPNQFVAIIKGESGIGKTRLVVQFFEQRIDRDPLWVALKIDRYTLDFDKLKFALAAGRNYILFVDDAQSFPPHVIADLKRLGRRQGRHFVKVIFTLRLLEANDTLQLIREFEKEKVFSIFLDKLSKQETKTIFEKELKHAYLVNFIDQLVYISRGRPILVVAILNAAAKNENITSIKNQSSLNEYVVGHFGVFIDQLVKQTGVEKLKVKNLLTLFCLLEPLPNADPTLIKRIVQTEEVSEDFVLLFFKQLKDTGVTTGSYMQSIKPDYYSDILLMQGVHQLWLKKKLEQYKDYAANILTNLASIEEVEKDEQRLVPSYLDTLLENYVAEMDLVSGQEFTKRLEFLRSVAYQKNRFAANGVTRFIAAIQNPEHPFYKESWAYKNKEYIRNDSTLGTIKGILHDLLYFDQYYDFVFDSIMSLYKLTNDKSLFDTTFSYQHSVYLHQHSLQIQKYFVKRCESLLSETEEDLILFRLHCLHELQTLSFTNTRVGLADRYTFRVSQHYLPMVPAVENHRLSILAVLQTYFQHYAGKKIKVEALKLLLDIPREMAAAKRDGNHYQSEKEIAALLNFLEKESPSFDTACKKETLDELYWYKKQRVPKSFFPQLERIKKALLNVNATDGAVQLLTRLENELLGEQEERHDETDAYIENYSAAELAVAISNIFQSPASAHCFPSLLNRLMHHHVSKARDVYVELKKRDMQFIYWYGSNFLRSLRRFPEFDSFFWDEVDFYLQEGTVEASNLLLHIYCTYFVDRSLLTERDVAVILEVLRNRPTLRKEQAQVLPTLYFFDNVAGKPALEEFLCGCGLDDAETLFRLLFDEGETDPYLHHLFLDYSVPFALTYSLEHCLTKIAKDKSVEEIFQYFMSRFSHKLSKSDEEQFYYDFMPTSDHSRFMEGLENEKRLALLSMVLKWFVTYKGEWRGNFAAKDLVDYVTPGDDFTADLVAVYSDVYQIYKEDLFAIERLVETLGEYHNKCANLISFASMILEDCHQRFATNHDFLSTLRIRLRQALTEAGGKSGTAGQPFPFDVRLKELLESQLSNYDAQSPTGHLLKDALKEVNRDIQRELVSEKDEW